MTKKILKLSNLIGWELKIGSYDFALECGSNAYKNDVAFKWHKVEE